MTRRRNGGKTTALVFAKSMGMPDGQEGSLKARGDMEGMAVGR